MPIPPRSGGTGPGAAPVGKASLARRLLAGSLDRAVDVAATLELRGYSLDAPRAADSEGDSYADSIGANDESYEVIEYIVSGPMFRTPTALQPPRTAVAGLRVSF